MLSTLSSFLPQLGGSSPAAANSAVKSPQSSSHDNQEATQEGKPSGSMAVDEQGVLKKKKERTHESFIVVRPPPAKNNHPLNLQVQLVPPSAKEQRSLSSRRSFDSTIEADESGVSLTRTASNRSEVSVYSGNTSVTSFSTVASTSSSATSPRRMIIPLYNLQAHNVLTNVIVDAGTDAKVAKFQKRGLEIVGLAVLEPIEVWSGASYDSDAAARLHRPQSFLIPDQHTPTSSAVSLTSDAPSTYEDHIAPMSPAAVPSTPPSDRNGPRKFFGKIFNKRKPTDPPPLSPGMKSLGGRPTPIPLDLSQESTPRATKRSSLLFTASNLTSHLPTQAPSSPAPGVHFQQGSNTLEPPPSATIQQSFQVLGIQPTLNSPSFPPKGKHPKAYVWVVRRWLKGGGDGLLGMLSDRAGNLGSGFTSGAGGVGAVEVRFEWTRSKARRSRSTATAESEGKERRRTLGGSSTPSISSIGHQPPPIQVSSLSAVEHQRMFKRRSRDVSNTQERSVDRDSRRSSSPNPPGSTHTQTTNASTDEASPRRRVGKLEGEEDAGEESDSEDSETPWTCTLILRTHHPHSSTGVHDISTPHEVKVKVGAVVPTPHHPKVVSLLKVPFPLPDIEVEKAAIRKRVVTPAGVARPTFSPVPSPGSNPNSPPSSTFASQFPPFSKYNGNGAQQKPALVLTAEEIKDVVSCTGLWLVVREGFGGVGKEKRKGDGWRIRG